MVENRNAGKVDVVLRAAPMLRLDSRVVDGTLTVPIPDANFGPETRVTLDDQQTANMGNDLEVAVRSPQMSITKQLGGVVRLGDGPSFIALGVGKILIRMGDDGKPFLEPEDPKQTRLFPTQASLAECAPGKLEAPFDDPPNELLDSPVGLATSVQSVEKDTAGCRVFSIATPSSSIVKLRACIPDAAYPFAADAPIKIDSAFITGSGGAAIQLQDEAGNELLLERVAFLQRIGSISNTALALDEEVTCSRIDAKCGDVEVPARITAMIGGTAHRAVFGEALPGSDAELARYVLGASGHPVTNLGCPRSEYEQRTNVATAQGSAWIVTVTRIPLGP